MPFKRATADQAQTARAKHCKKTDRGMVMLKGFRAPTSWNPDERSARFIMSTENVDRYRDIVVQAGLDTTNFEKNPQALLFHMSCCWPIGNWADVQKVLGGRPKRTEGTLQFMPEGDDEDADRAAIHVMRGTIRTVSIGFLPNWDDVEMILDNEDQWTGGFRYPTSELFECSLVPIPAQPDALVKALEGGAENDLKWAVDLIEDVLDTWTRTPEGLLIPLEDYRKKHLDLTGQRSSYVVDKDLVPELKFVAVKDRTLKATTAEGAAAMVGATVIFDPAHTENKGFPFDALQKAEGTVIASYIIGEGEHKGVHALSVEFLTNDWSGMFRGITADRFALVAKAEESADPALEAQAVEETEDKGKAPCPPMDDPMDEEEDKDKKPKKPCAVVDEDGQKAIVVPITLDASSADAEIGRLSRLIEALSEKFASIFRREKPVGVGTLNADEVYEAEPPAPPAPEVIAAARTKAAETLAALQEAGRI